MLAKQSQTLLALVAVLTLTLGGCAIGKKNIAPALYTSQPVVPPIEQLGSSGSSPASITSSIPAASFMGGASSCRRGVS